MTDRVDLRRRTLVRLAMAAPLVAVTVAACTDDGNARKWTPSAPTDRDSHVRWRSVRAEQRLIAMHRAVIEQHPDFADVADQMIKHHEDHLAAILADGPLPVGALPIGDNDQNVPNGKAAAMSTLRAAEDAASTTHADACVAATGPVLATLLGSIAASEAGHATLLSA